MAYLLINTFTKSLVRKCCITSNLFTDNNFAYNGVAFMALSYEKPILYVVITWQNS